MKKTNSTRTLLVTAAALTLSLFIPRALAADKAWSGAGGNDYWMTGANWGGTAPINADNLIFGAGARQNNTNDFAALSVNVVSFTNGGFVLNGNSFTVNGVAPAFFTNTTGTNIIAGPMTTGPAPGGKYWWVAPNSELRLLGAVTNTAIAGTSIGWLNLTNGGTVRIMGSARSIRGSDLFLGTIVVDGGLAEASSDGYVLKAPTGGTARLQVINNGTLRIGGGGNLRIGNSRAGIGSPAQFNGTNIVEIQSGLIELYGANVTIFCGDNVAGARAIFNQNGGLVWGSAGSGNTLAIGNLAGADGIYNLNGGVLWIAQVRQAVAGAERAEFNFNGGTLKPTASSTTFMQGLQTANVQAGGAVIDTTNFNITIAQSLAGSGGLMKLGDGALTLTGGNTYTGTTTVSNGTLATSSASFQGGGAITVAGTGNLSVAYTGSSLSASTLTVGSAVTNSLTLDLGATPTPGGSPVISVNALNGSGTALIHINASGLSSGDYPLITFTTPSGLSSIKLGTLPLGVSGTLVQSGNTLNLHVALVPKNLAWRGSIDGNWNTSTFNWADLNNGNNPTNYNQSGGSGDAVTFDDGGASGVTTINIAGTVTPSQWVANNNITYTLAGAGKISGPTSLMKSGTGFGTLTLGTANDYAGGTTLNAGNIYVGSNQALGLGPVTLNFGTLACDGTTARTLSNSIIVNADAGVVLGDTVNTGDLQIAGTLDLGGGTARELFLNSDVVITGSLTNGGLTRKTGPGRLVIKGQAQQTGLVDHRQGDTIIDGGWLDSANGWRLQNYFSGTTLRFAVTNGGAFTLNRDSANFRVGLTGGDNTCDNILDVAGLFSLYSATGNGRVDMGQSGANDLLHLRTGGRLICRSITSTSPGYTEANFDGGTLVPIATEAAFLQGLTNAYIRNGGLTVDTTNFSVTIAQALLGAGSGGLVKNGAGTLTLSGANSYSGATVVNAGKLVLGAAHAATGGITVVTNTTLAFLTTSPGVSSSVSTVTAAGGAILEAQFSGLTNNPTSPAGSITTLVLNGTVSVNLVSSGIKIGQFPLFGYGTISGAGHLAVGQLPQGIIGTIVTNTGAKTIDLVVSSVTPLIWTAATSGDWNTSATNWSLSGVPATYAQGDNVFFNDTAGNATVNMTLALTPGGMTVSNSALSYQFGGSGLGGSMSLTKDGTNSLALNSANSFAGTVTVKAGRLIAGNATALGAAAAGTTVQNGASLDINGNGLGAEPVVLSGSGAGGLGALDNSGPDQNNALIDVTLTGNTTIRAGGTLGIRMPNDTDPGFHGNGYKLTKIGPGQVNLNGGQTTAGGTYIWDCDLGDLDILEGTFSFQRRMTMGRVTNAVHVAPGATLLLFALNTSMPIQTKPVYLTNATLSANGNNASEGTTFGGPVHVAAGSNFLTTSAGVTLALNGAVSGPGSISCSGVVQLAAANTYTGDTVVSSGTLQLAASGSIATTPSITVLSGATFDVSAFAPWTLGAGKTLAGAGAVNGSVQANGTVSPGTSIGTLTFTNDLALAGITLMELSKDGGLTNDVVAVNGTLTYGGTLKLVLTGATPLAVNDTFKLFSFGSTPTGSFTLDAPAGSAWDTSQLTVDGTIRATAVPSPKTKATFTSMVVSGGSLVLGGTNANGSYVLYTSTNVAAPLVNWTPVYTNNFSGPFSFTNTMSGPQRFYLLQ